MAQKVDVAIQSYKKPESLIYTLLSLKKQSERHIDTIYINDDCSKDGSIELYNSTKFKDALYPISVKIRENKEASGYTNTLMTKELYWKHSLKERLRLNCLTPLHRLKMMELENDIRYEWAINSTNKDYLYLIHDDIIFYDDVLSLYMEEVRNDERIAITGDLGGVPLCPYGPCGEHCSPEKVMTGLYPSEIYPMYPPKTLIHRIIGRYNRSCRINEWTCLINVKIARKIRDEKGICFGNYEDGADVGGRWFKEIIDQGYRFTDPLPREEQKNDYYLHCWQGHAGHDVVTGKVEYRRGYIKERLLEDFGYEI